MEPWQSWTIVGVASVGAYWYYNRQNNAKRRAGRLLSVAEQGHAARGRVDSKGRKWRDKTPGTLEQPSDAAEASSASLSASGNEQIKKRKQMKNQPSKLASSSTVEVTDDDRHVRGVDASDEGIDNKEFARQLAGLKTGTSLKPPVGMSQPRQRKKKGKANILTEEASIGSVTEVNNTGGPQDVSGTSSTTGADADDDLSSSTSPTFGATNTSSGEAGISDMLEAPAPGPSILRLIEPTQPQRVSQAKQPKSFQVQETKKQRQNQQKKEVKKLEREQTEKERKVLLERQRRTAREAEGRPAKNGLASKAPTTNSWAKSNGNVTAVTNATPGASGDAGSLLDTFEENPKSAETKIGAHRANGASILNEKAWSHDLPSEEEQIRILSEIEGDGGWNTVEKGKKRKGKTSVNDVVKEDIPRSSVQVKPKHVSASESDSSYETSIGRVDDKGFINGKYLPFADSGHPLDSDWAV
ncbi:hypothetical protein MMC06_001425 [Schaereria dolodes]|nr:hypothetical protein [Schaereria dolodes]